MSDSILTCFLPCCIYKDATFTNEESVFTCSNRWNGVSIHQIISYYKEHFVMSAYFTHGQQVTHAAAPANAAMAVNKVRGSAPASPLTPIYRPRNKSQPQSGRTRLPSAALLLNTPTRLAAGTCFSSDLCLIAFCID